MLSQDITYALRGLRRRPGFAAVVVLTLGLGIGLNTAILSVVLALLVHPLPFPEPETLLVPKMVDQLTGNEHEAVAYADYLDWRRQQDLFEQVALCNPSNLDLIGDGEPERIAGAAVSEAYFPLVRARSLVGRLLESSDYAPGAGAVTVLGRGLWQRRFGGRSDVVGETIRLGDVSATVIGVVDLEPVILQSAQVWYPLDLGNPVPEDVLRRDNFFLRALIRLHPGVEPAAAQARLSALAAQVAEQLPNLRGTTDVALLPLRDWFFDADTRLLLGLIFVTVFLILVVACFNIANLLLARSVERRSEIAVRLALGAGRGRLLRQLITESLVLALLGGIAGLLLATWGTSLLRARATADLPGLAQVGVDLGSLSFALLLAGATALFFGLLPAWQLTNTGLNEVLRSVAAGASGGHRGRRLRSALVIAELAVSLVLLVTAGMMYRSVSQMSNRQPGVDIDQRLGMTLLLPGSRYPDDVQVDDFYQRALDEVGRLPRVVAVAGASTVPLGGERINLSRSHLAAGAPEPPAGPEQRAQWNVVTPDYFRTVGMPLLRGRAFDPRDHADATPVTIINELLAEQLFPGQDPVGQHLRSWRDENVLREVVGVVGSVRYWAFTAEPEPMVYVPYRQVVWPPLRKLVVHTDGDPLPLLAEVRSAVWRLDPDLPITGVATFEEVVAEDLAVPRIISLLMACFTALALALAVIGIYGIVSYSVTQRTREIGLRMALGAGGNQVLWMVVRHGLMLTSLGGAFGLLIAIPWSRVLAGKIDDVRAMEPTVYLALVLVIAAVTAAASLGPARRAVRVDPQEALRYE